MAAVRGQPLWRGPRCQSPLYGLVSPASPLERGGFSSSIIATWPADLKVQILPGPMYLVIVPLVHDWHQRFFSRAGAWPPAELPRRPGAGCGSPRLGVSARGCTSERRKTHVTEAAEVLYPWHPWFGRVVHIHGIIERGGERSFRCDLSEKRTARCMHIPAWMFDRAACLRVRGADTPWVELTALVCLKALLAEVANRTSEATGVVGATNRFENRGDADARSQWSTTNHSTGSVPIVEPTVTRLAMLVGRGAGKGDALNSAHAQPTRSCNLPGQSDGGRDDE